MGLWAECVEWVWRRCLVRTKQEGSGEQQRDQRKPGGMPTLCGIEVANRATGHGASPPEAKVHCMEILSMHMEPLHWFTHSLTAGLPSCHRGRARIAWMSPRCSQRSPSRQA